MNRANRATMMLRVVEGNHSLRAVSSSIHHLERWLSGRKHRFAKAAWGLNSTAGSNPALSVCLLVLFPNRFGRGTCDHESDWHSPLCQDCANRQAPQLPFGHRVELPMIHAQRSRNSHHSPRSPESPAPSLSPSATSQEKLGNLASGTGTASLTQKVQPLHHAL